MLAALVSAAVLSFQGVDSWEAAGPFISDMGDICAVPGTDYLYAQVKYPGPDEVFFSTNGGSTWFGGLVSAGGCYSMDTDENGNVYVGGVSCLYIHTGPGDPWSEYFTVQDAVLRSVASQPSRSSFKLGAVSGVANSLIYSNNHGHDWSPMETSPPVEGMSVEFSQADPQVVYLAGRATSTDADYLAVYRSDDGGWNWTEITPSTIPVGSYSKVGLSVSSSDTLLVFANNDIYRTANGGSSWSMASLPADIQALRFTDNYGSACAITASALYTSSDWGQSWTQSSTTPGSSREFCVTGYGVHLATISGHYSAPSPSGSWEPGNNGIPGGCIGGLKGDPLTGFPLCTGKYFLTESPYQWYQAGTLYLNDDVMELDRSDTSSDLIFAAGEYG